MAQIASGRQARANLTPANALLRCIVLIVPIARQRALP